MDGLSSAASVIAVIQLAGSVVKICGGYIQEVNDARDDIITLQRAVAGLKGILQKLQELLQDPNGTNLPVSSSLANSIADCRSDLGALEKNLDPRRGKQMMRRFGIRALKWPLKRTEAERIIRDLDRYKSSFILSLQVDQATLLTGVARSADCFHQNLDLDKLPIARGAEFGSYMDQHEDECLPGTRTEILRQITEWCRSPQGKGIFWLNGRAGTGKSTISRTVARSSKEAKLLGASFFFKRGEGDRGDAIKLFPTIAKQLVVRLPQLIPGVQKAISDDPNLATKSLKEQFVKLLLQPLRCLDKSIKQAPTVVVVIDALDECEVDNDIRVILQILPRLQEQSAVNLRIFLTSRPDLPIRLGFSDIRSQDHQDLVLHEIPEAVTAHDISLFLNWRLSRIRKERLLAIDWPGDADFQALVTLCVPLFIFAATVCRILEDPQWDPMDSLTEILAHGSEGSQLNGTYLPVVNRLVNNQNGRRKMQLVREFREVIGTIVMLESPLSITSLSRLIGVSERLIGTRLDALNSVICIPEDKTEPVRIFHQSFREFLLDPETREKTLLWVDEKEIHQRLATQCLSICDGLKRNICGLPSDGTQRGDIAPQTVNHCLSSELQYSCCFWSEHLKESKDHSSVLHEAFSVMQKHFLHWVEAMSILGLGADALGIINRLEPIIHDYEISQFFRDAKRFILKNRQIAELAPLQVYCSGLVFAPKKAIIRRQFQEELPAWIEKLPNVEETWSAHLQTLEGHESSILSMAFSPDGKLLASGSGDKSIRLWDATTGALQQTLNGHVNVVSSVAFSLNGWLATGSYDSTIRLWDTATGSLQRIFKEASCPVSSVVFSPNGRLLATGSADNTVRLWDAATGSLQQYLRGHLGMVLSVVFSPDGRLLASGSADHTIRLWDAANGSLQRTLEGCSGIVSSLAFSPDSKKLVSGDHTVRLWDPTTGSLQQILEGHSDYVLSVVFSPNGRLLATGSVDHTVRLWNIATNALQNVFKGHEDLISSVAFSSDGRLLASSPFDNTVRLWDTATVDMQQTLESHSDKVTSVAFSSERLLLASGSGDDNFSLFDATGSGDYTVRLWDPATGALRQSLEGHSNKISSLKFSPSGQLLASSSYDKTIRLWDTATGAIQQTFKGHLGEVLFVIFSPDGRLLVSGSTDHTVRLWDTATNALQMIFEGHENSVLSAAFSSDSRLLASSSYDNTVRLWDPATGALRRTFGIEGRIVDTLEFSDDASHLITNLGFINIQSSCNDHMSNPPQKNDKFLSQDHQWIMLHGKRALWLPPEYRPTCSMAQSNTLVMGHASGRVSFMCFIVN